jgi:hypothetical protein
VASIEVYDDIIYVGTSDSKIYLTDLRAINSRIIPVIDLLLLLEEAEE